MYLTNIVSSNIILVVTGHPAEAQLIIDGHGMTDILLLVRHLAIAGLWSSTATKKKEVGLVMDLGLGFKKKKKS